MKSKRGRKFMLNHAKSIALTEDKIERLIHGRVLINKPYETMPLEVAINKQTKEKEMPDIKSELSKVLNQWDKHEDEIRNPNKEKQVEKTYGFKTTNNVTRETFNYVRDNPFQARRQIKAALTSRGFKEGSIDALLTQMCNGGLITRSPDGTYVAKVQEFRPVKLKDKVKPKAPAHKAKKTEPPSAGIAALAPDTKQEAKTSIILNRGWTPEKAIENLNVIQARALYDELKKIFGG